MGRLYQLDIPIFAITGSIGTGKSTVIDYLYKKGHPCLDADRLIKLIYQRPEARTLIAGIDKNFVTGDGINFTQLRQAFFNDDEIKKKIESYLYGKLPEQFRLELAKLPSPRYLFYDIPLLFEKSLEDKFDCTITVYCPRSEQLQRVIQRDGISPELATQIIDSQMDIEEKKRRSDYVLDNTSTVQNLFNQVDELLELTIDKVLKGDLL